MAFMPNAINLTKTERVELTKQATSRTGRAEDARRARLVLLLAEGHTWDEICERLPCSRGFIDSWSKRFAADRVGGLYSRHRPERYCADTSLGGAHSGMDVEAQADRWFDALEYPQAGNRIEG